MATNSLVLRSDQSIIKAIQELREAGGGTLYLPPSDEPYSLKASRTKDLGRSDAEVTITSLDPDSPVQFEQILLKGVSNLNFSNIEFNDKKNGSSHADQDIKLLGSEDIHFDNIKMESLASGWADAGDPRYGGGMIRNSDNISITNSTITDYSFGFSLLDSDNVTFSHNEMTGIQGDGLRIGGGTNVEISHNSFHDFHGSNQKGYTHSDVIQYWGANTYSDTVGLAIIGNYINPGVGTQGIFGHNMHGNENAQRHHFYDFTISDNILVMGSANGLVLADVNGLTVTNNTLLWNQFTLGEGNGMQGLSTKPWLSVNRITGGVIDGNLVARLTNGNDNIDLEFGDNLVLTNQQIIDNFINAINLAGESGLRDFMLVTGSEFDGAYGSSLTWSTSAPAGLVSAMSVCAISGAAQAYTFDASHSLYSGFSIGLLGEDATFTWVFDDGTEMNGPTVSRVFADSGMHDVSLKVTLADGTTETITRRVEIKDAVLLDIDFKEGTQDKSWYGSQVEFIGDVLELDTDGATRPHISTGNFIRLPRAESQSQLWGQEAFTLSFDVEAASRDAGGYLVYAHGAFTISSSKDGRMTITLSTADGGAKLVTEAGVMDHDGVHRVSVIYSSEDGLLQLRVDDVQVGEIELTGQVVKMSSSPFIFGAPFNKGVFDSYIDNIKMVNYATVTDAEVDDSDGFIADQNYGDDTALSSEPGDAPDMLQDQDSDIGIIAQLDFDGDVSDSSGRDLTVNAAKDISFGEGVTGQAIEFTGQKGTGANIAKGNEAIHDLDAFTIAANVRMDTDAGGQIITFGKAFRLDAQNNGDLVARLWTEDGTVAMKVKGVLSDHDFHRLAFTYSDDADTFRFYVDGELAAERQISGGTAEASHHGIQLGANWSRSIVGSMDDFVMLDDAVNSRLIHEDATAVALELAGSVAWADALLQQDALFAY